jgi:hypothetical protein
VRTKEEEAEALAKNVLIPTFIKKMQELAKIDLKLAEGRKRLAAFDELEAKWCQEAVRIVNMKDVPLAVKLAVMKAAETIGAM